MVLIFSEIYHWGTWSGPNHGSGPGLEIWEESRYSSVWWAEHGWLLSDWFWLMPKWFWRSWRGNRPKNLMSLSRRKASSSQETGLKILQLPGHCLHFPVACVLEPIQFHHIWDSAENTCLLHASPEPSKLHSKLLMLYHIPSYSSAQDATCLFKDIRSMVP